MVSHYFSLNVYISHSRQQRKFSLIPNPFPNNPFFLCVCRTQLLKTVRKGEIACSEQFLLFPTVFSTFLKKFPPLLLNQKLSSASSFTLEV